MTDLKIPPSGYRTRAGNAWPTHAGKRRTKRANRARVIADLNERKANDALRLI